MMMGNRITFLIGPEAHEPFLRKGDDEMDQNEPYSFAIPLFGPGVVYDVSVEKRNQQLKMIKGSLSTIKLRSYVGLIVQEAEMFFNKVRTPSNRYQLMCREGTRGSFGCERHGH
jgi:sterol 14alpha-demethylase